MARQVDKPDHCPDFRVERDAGLVASDGGNHPLSHYYRRYRLLVAHKIFESSLCICRARQRRRHGTGAGRTDIHPAMGNVD